MEITGEKSQLIAGAGTGTIVFPEEMFPMPEGFSGIDLAPHVRVMLLRNDIRTAIIAAELVNTPADLIAEIRRMTAEKTGTPEGNVWVSSSHAFCTPHAPRDEADLKLFNEAVLAAARKAIDEAAANLGPAYIGTAKGMCSINVNNETCIGDKWFDSFPNPSRPSDKTLTVIRVDDMDGRPVGIMFSYGIRSSCADAPRGTRSGRMITPDLTGEACCALEEEYGVPVMFLNSAAADQMPAEVALYNRLSSDGAGAEQVWDSENGIQSGLIISKKMGRLLADHVSEIIRNMSADGEGIIGHARGSFEWDNLAGDARVSIPVEVMTIDSLAMAAVRTEICAETAISFRNAAEGFDNAVILTFVNGDQSYMPAASTYDEGSRVSSKSSLKKGAAEEFVRVAVGLLNSDLERTNAQPADLSAEETAGFEGTDARSAGSIVTIGGIEWLVLAETNGRQLVITRDIIGHGPFNESGGRIRWADCSLRKFLNGEFLNNFSDEEVERIEQTVCANKANSVYAAGSGEKTTDLVFLLSEEEARGYFAEDAGRRANDPVSGKASSWWLRTTGKDPEFAEIVLGQGTIFPHGSLAGKADLAKAGDTYEDCGIRPAMWISE